MPINTIKQDSLAVQMSQLYFGYNILQCTNFSNYYKGLSSQYLLF